MNAYGVMLGLIVVLETRDFFVCCKKIKMLIRKNGYFGSGVFSFFFESMINLMTDFCLCDKLKLVKKWG